ncbi:DUF4834 family protein [Bacteroides sp. AN502(2024)]|uniref:DUF4834 family protein n=1 Tax=Bacteroides sp. AN502(2024) TaxID=3160599 RepID=UPI0035164013
MYILLFIFIFIITILVFGLSIISFILRTIFGFRRTNQQDHDQSNRRPMDEEDIYSENISKKRHKKIFTRDDGEYVDFEEIK